MKEYAPEPVIELLLDVLERRNETPRAASLNAGLSHGTVSSFLNGVRPGRESCLALSFYFGWDPNYLLVAAGHEPVEAFGHGDLDAKKLPPDLAELVYRVQRLSHPVRERLLDSITSLLDTCDAVEAEMAKVKVIGGEVEEAEEVEVEEKAGEEERQIAA